MMKFADLKGYIFDLDGTLLASTGLWYGIYRKALARFGIEMPDDYVAHVNHLDISRGTAYTAERFGLSCGAEGVAKVWREYAGDAYASAIEMTPHAKELLSALSALGKKLGIATALDEDLARAMRIAGIPKKAKLSSNFDVTILSMVEHNLGVTIMPRLILEGSTADVAAIPLDPPLKRTLGMALRSEREATPAMLRLIDCAKGVLGI